MRVAAGTSVLVALAAAVGHALPATETDRAGIDFRITPERLVRSTSGRMEGFQRLLERRYARQQQADQQFVDQNQMRFWQEQQPNYIQSAWHTVSSGLRTTGLAGHSLAKWLDYLVPAAAHSDKHHNISQPAYLSQPLDHFDNTTSARFDQRFFYSTRHYKPAAHRKHGEAVPIYILDSGEANAEQRIPFLDTGILDILSEATGGIGIVLEHRYYGTSVPNRTELGSGDSWGVDQLRWLTNKQALKDSAEFIRRLDIPGTDNSEHRKVIYYGGSYPGVRSAHMRLLYPDLVHGAIASSAVVAAVDEFPEYFYPVARGAPTACSQAIQAAVAEIDKIIAPNPYTGGNQPERDANATAQLLELFGLTGLSNVADLANLNMFPLGAFQSLNWDARVSSTEFDALCKTLTTYGVSGYEAGSISQQWELSNKLVLPREVHACAKFMRDNYITPCTRGEDGEAGESPDACFSADYDAFAKSTKLTAGRAWTFQYCSTWGYIMTSPPPAAQYKTSLDGQSRYFVPSGPKLVSTLVDYNYAHEVCEKGFPAGEHFTMPARPDIDQVNSLGGFQLQVDRLAFIDGQYDPWRPATVHSEEYAHGGARPDTLQRPFKLIPDCWHHCDENGVKNPAKTPRRVRLIHEQQVQFVKHWLRQE